MRRTVYLVVALAFAAAVFLGSALTIRTADARVLEDLYYGITNLPGVNVRKKAAQTSDVLGQIRNTGSLVVIYEDAWSANRKWYRIRTWGQNYSGDHSGLIQGWVRSDLIDPITYDTFMEYWGVLPTPRPTILYYDPAIYVPPGYWMTPTPRPTPTPTYYRPTQTPPSWYTPRPGGGPTATPWWPTPTPTPRPIPIPSAHATLWWPSPTPPMRLPW